ncbi:MAG: EpsD family peptidyl-prolyl cis-trans isomerase [Pseudomonadota bacterium]|nr:EpsD family peptidyl-prolyl cis-trans isomerase [Pseudomonadota bacterium]
MHASRLLPRALFLAVALALTACGGKSDKPAEKSGDAKTESQLVAKVNDQEISIHQLNIALGQLPANLPPEKMHEAAKQSLDRLIEQEIFVQRAVEKKLDRDPRVEQLIEASRRQILARAYIEGLAQGTTTASRSEVDAFYDKHPELFSARRAYRLQQLSLSAPMSNDSLKAVIDGAKDLGDVVKRLAAQKIGFNETTATVLPEQLPMAIAEEFAHLKVGSIVSVPAPNGGAPTIDQILAVQDAPLSKDKAAPAVERFLNNQRQTTAISTELKTLKDKAKIVYLGEFDPKREAEKKPDLGAAGPGTGAVTVDQKTLANDPAGVVTVKKDATANEPSGAVTVKSDRARSDASGVVTVAPDAMRK